MHINGRNVELSSLYVLFIRRPVWRMRKTCETFFIHARMVHHSSCRTIYVFRSLPLRLLRSQLVIRREKREMKSGMSKRIHSNPMDFSLACIRTIFVLVSRSFEGDHDWKFRLNYLWTTCKGLGPFSFAIVYFLPAPGALISTSPSTCESLAVSFWVGRKLELL